MIDVLSAQFLLRGVTEYIRSDNGPEFVAKALQGWIAAVGAKTAYIAPGSVWKNGHLEFQRPSQRQTAGRGDLLFARGGQGRDRDLSTRLQHRAASRIVRLQAAGARGLHA